MTYALVMIVKNEETRVEKCLVSAKKYCDKAFITDTGSTDKTIEICESYFPGSVTTEPWVNFGVNRSHAIARAFGSADWLLTLDADMEIEIDDDFVPNLEVDAYHIKMVLPGREWWLPLVVRGDLPWEYEGAVHEFKTLRNRPYTVARTDKIRIESKQHGTIEKIQDRAEVLEQELEKDPSNLRNLYYLASTYLDLGRVEEARELFTKRGQALDSEEAEETWHAAFLAAVLQERWEDRLARLMDVWHLRPHRPEPIYAMVQEMNIRGLHFAAYALCPTGYPANNDICFLHPAIEDYLMKFERSVAAYHVGNIKKAIALNYELLENPNLPDGLKAKVKENLSLCQPEVTQ